MDLGRSVDATIQDTKEFGTVLELSSGETGFVVNENMPPSVIGEGEDGVTSGKASRKKKQQKKTHGVVLDVNPLHGIVDVSLQPRLLALTASQPTKKKQSRQTKKKKAVNSQLENLVEGEEVEATVELVKEDYLVLSVVKNGQLFIGYGHSRDFNDPRPSNNPQRFNVDQVLHVRVLSTAQQDVKQPAFFLVVCTTLLFACFDVHTRRVSHTWILSSFHPHALTLSFSFTHTHTHAHTHTHTHMHTIALQTRGILSLLEFAPTGQHGWSGRLWCIHFGGPCETIEIQR